MLAPDRAKERKAQVKKALNFAFGLISLVMLVDFYEAYGRMGGLKPIQLWFLVIIGLVAFLLQGLTLLRANISQYS